MLSAIYISKPQKFASTDVIVAKWKHILQNIICLQFETVCFTHTSDIVSPRNLIIQAFTTPETQGSGN